jgi:regulatory protein SWI6
VSAITSLLSQTEKEFSSEMAAKQSIIDSIHVQLRESSAHLGEERRRLERLQQRAKEREERKQKIANLRRAAEEEHFRLSQMQQQEGQLSNGIMEMQMGDADKTFSPLPPNLSPTALIHDQRLAASLPSNSALRARVNAYIANNDKLDEEVRDQKSKSRDLEGKYRRIISLCTHVDEDKIDSVLDNLFRAVDSEHGDVELGRVRDFLQKVEGVD